MNTIIPHSSEFTQKTGTCELCPSPLCPSVYQKQLATGQKLGLEIHQKIKLYLALPCMPVQSPMPPLKIIIGSYWLHEAGP